MDIQEKRECFVGNRYKIYFLNILGDSSERQM